MILRETFAAGAFQCNCTVLACDEKKEAIVIDPGGDVERIQQIIRHYDLRITHVIHTHAHLDHIHCTRDVVESLGGAICLHRDDLFLYDGLEQQAAMFGWSARAPLPVTRFFEHGETIEFGTTSALVVHTPGHTPGSVCFEVIDGANTLLFSGDTLFRRSVGRTDLPGGNTQELLKSIRQRIYTRAPDSLVIPGHGPTTTIAAEATHNPFVTA